MIKIRKSEETKKAEILACAKELFIKCHTNIPFDLTKETKGVAVSHTVTAIRRLDFLKFATTKRTGVCLYKWDAENIGPDVMADMIYKELNLLLQEYRENETIKETTHLTGVSKQLGLLPETNNMVLVSKGQQLGGTIELVAHETPGMFEILQELLSVMKDTDTKVTELFNQLK